MAMWNRRLTLTELQSTRPHRNAQQAKQSVIFVPQRSRLTLFGEKRNKRPKKIPRDLEYSLNESLKSAKLKQKQNLSARCSKSKNENSLVGKIGPNDTEAIPQLENSMPKEVRKHSFRMLLSKLLKVGTVEAFFKLGRICLYETCPVSLNSFLFAQSSCQKKNRLVNERLC
ncbi:hypothetical protein T4A_14149 [Trichinella pseudospiralis]|uniref:Uncharacterized protein n=1 Tax=Trichinella pseudospiralis TaxID=6337 RepID=A0A0V1EY48_TRIPS|nr:hypothetical protein T4A_14149 [Trichinella pseudospiralis]